MIYFFTVVIMCKDAYLFLFWWAAVAHGTVLGANFLSLVRMKKQRCFLHLKCRVPPCSCIKQP